MKNKRIYNLLIVIMLVVISLACSACSKDETRHSSVEGEEKQSDNVLERIDHNQVPVMDLDQSIDWYVRLLGFKLVDKPNNDLAVLSLSSGSTLLLWQTSDKTQANFMKNGETTPVIFFETKNINKLQDILMNHDVKIESITDEGFAKFIRFYDINGNMFGAIENAD